MAEITTLAEAVVQLVRDGEAVALEGFTHLIPFAAGHELLRQGRTELELIRMTPDILYDQMVGMGAARKLVFSYGGNPGVGSLHRFRDAVEHGWPRTIELEEHSHAGMANRFAAGAARHPFAVMRGYVGTDLERIAPVRPIVCPFTGEVLTAVPALRPDVAIVHAQEADREGNVQLWGIPGVQKEAVLCADRSLVTVKRVVETLAPRPGGVVIPGWVIDAVAVAPGGSQPSYAAGITERDNDFYRFWTRSAAIARTSPAGWTRTSWRAAIGTRDELGRAPRGECRGASDDCRGPSADRRSVGLHRRGAPEPRGAARPYGPQPVARARLRVRHDRC